jgi:hypothetical protein
MIFVTTAQPTQDHVYRVVDFQRRLVFAGKLGNRIEDTMTVAHGDKMFRIRFAPLHDRFGKVAVFEKGTMVTIRGAIDGDRIVANRENVKASN